MYYILIRQQYYKQDYLHPNDNAYFDYENFDKKLLLKNSQKIKIQNMIKVIHACIFEIAKLNMRQKCFITDFDFKIS